ncbi:hypothetical protein R1sor_020612 [Riccia sorocarpa]|uniref:Uncharacterized protein n=1 Tax=Riccia sorocarpa TaxID=122646 RepID=A0ABD3GGC5_9MARC
MRRESSFHAPKSWISIDIACTSGDPVQSINAFVSQELDILLCFRSSFLCCSLVHSSICVFEDDLYHRVFVALALVLILAAHGASASTPFPVVGRNFTIVNNQTGGSQPPCPERNPNYAAFFKNGVVQIRGYFAAAGIGVCTDGGQTAVPENVVINYELYDDTIVFAVPDRVRTASRLFNLNSKKVVLHLVQDFEVSVLKDIGPVQGLFFVKSPCTKITNVDHSPYKGNAELASI